ncbi:histidine phosphatase family protein [Caproicibacterium amylolyticum]|jgi:alpha-ribazole phosphatase|uniref:Histidine phosphatase family protein n=1 Tax=Caproicibacterium amylolyticum TaxID=2766537 RepID=A0A7G9WHV5_9FIRM|nr:histidine phosphatase family protein [Caproicibacterium amylolyticum]MBE6721130.1 histidine phosphatase family protein [Oscillospiraceae bacterium]QNO18267.1 histidine phosphatase family protein [Caproicibacterium amylolyticum]
MQSYLIHLIRHGLTDGNLEGRYIGSTDISLCEQGKELLKEQKKQHPYPAAQVCYSSPMHRCLQTAKILYPELTPQVITDFRETDFGEWENKTAAQLAKEDPDFAAWMEGGKQVTPPGGENGGWFMQRTCAAFEHMVDGMLRQDIHSAAAILHGGSMMAILAAYGLPRAQFYDWMTQPGCGYSLRITPGLWMRSMVAEVYETIPPREEQTQQEQTERVVLDVAREAASRAYSKEEKEHAGENKVQSSYKE